MDAKKINDNQSEQVDIRFLVKILRAVLVRMLVIGVVCGAVAGAFRYFTTEPTYSSGMTYYVNAVARASDGTTVVNPGSTTSARDLAENFVLVIESSMVIDDVVIDLQNKAQYGDKYQDVNRESIKKMVNATVDAQVLTVEIVHEDAVVAYEVAKAFEKVIPGKLDYCVAIQTASGGEEYDSVAKLMDKAELDDEASGRGTLTFALLGFLLGVALVYLVGFLRAFFDNTVYDEEDIKAYFTIPLIGQIPTWSNENGKDGKKKQKKKSVDPSSYVNQNGVSSSNRDYSGRLLSEETPFAIAEAFKLLRTNMCYTTKGESCAVFGVTSAYVGAGKSILIANTAISFSQMGKKVLLLDGDLRCPVQHRIFGMDPKSYGLSEVLAGVCKNDNDAIRPSSYEGLDLVTSGRIPPNPAELLASSKMRSFMEEAKKHYDVIFIDLPPICEVTDAGVLSDIVTGFVFVIRAAYSDRRLVNMAVETMENLGGSIVGFILNDVDIKSGEYYKNKYYGYGNYKYGKYGKYKHSSYGKYGKISMYGKYGNYGYAGKYGYDRKSSDYRYGYTDTEMSEQHLERSDSGEQTD